MRPTKIALFLTVAALAFGQNGDGVDAPGQSVARLGAVTTEASIRHAESGEWTGALRNQPLLAGDSVSVAGGGRAEIQFDGGNFVRLAGDTEVRIAAFEGNHLRLELARGLVLYRVLHDTGLAGEVSTPSVSVQPIRQSGVRIEVGPDGSIEVSARRGEVEVASPRGTESLREGRALIARGNPDDPEFQTVAAAGRDSFDAWNDERDRYLLSAHSTRYVSPDVFGTEDLDAYGRWDNDPSYGDVWTPHVAASWSPYQNGQWIWADYYGWTWVEDSPWGWAPFHYGTWYQRAGFGWTWFPGRRAERVWWRPGMVAFFGFGDGYGSVGWIPLAPFERYRPWYGRGFNGSAAFSGRMNTGYRNWQGATGVRRSDFERGQFRNRVVVSRDAFERGTAGSLPPRMAQAGGLAQARRDGSGQRFFKRDAARPRGEPAAREGSDNWSRFGAPREVRSGGQQDQFSSQRERPVRAVTGGRDSSGWRRFGSPPEAGADGNRQDRFGRERGGAPSVNRPERGIDSRPESRPAAREIPRPAFSQPAARRVDVAPSIVRRRESGARGGESRSVNSPGGGGGDRRQAGKRQ